MFCVVGTLYFFRWLVSRLRDGFGNLRISFPFVFLGCLVFGGGGGLLSTSRRLGELEILLVLLAMDSLSVAWAHMPLGRGISLNSQE